jgi:hypothetical protein
MNLVCDAGDAIRLMKAPVKYFLIQAAPLSVNKRQKVARKICSTRVCESHLSWAWEEIAGAEFPEALSVCTD